MRRFDEEDRKYMRLALSRAQLALEKGEVPVGCVLVSAQGEVLCRTQNEGASMAAVSTFSVPSTLVLTASTGKNSQLGTCLRAAAWKT